jgi:hypothetical protein
MTKTGDEATWRTEFERMGEKCTWDSVRAGYFEEPKRQFAYRWLTNQALEQQRRETLTIRYLQFTLLAAVVGVVVGIIGVFATLQ